MAKVIFILLDGLDFEAAQERFCYLRALCEARSARLHKTRSQLPPLSRPVYATMLAGLAPLEHGILRNEDRRQLARTFFSDARQKGLKTAAAAYHWFFELCIAPSFGAKDCRFFNDESAPIQRGIFYSNDDYPDAELFADAEFLLRGHDPDLLLVHSMGIDHAGHQSGADSRQYAAACQNADSLLAEYLPGWLAGGHQILIASDHGMDAQGSHYSAGPQIMAAPLWLIGSAWPEWKSPRQTDIRAMILAALDADYK